MRRFFLFVAVVLCLPKVVIAQAKESVVPAGTLLQCTLDEPRFSSETAQVGDPVVCHVSSLGMFGRSVFHAAPICLVASRTSATPDISSAKAGSSWNSRV